MPPSVRPQEGEVDELGIGSSVALTANMLRDHIIRTAVVNPGSPLSGVRPEDVEVVGGRTQLRTDPSRGEAHLEARDDIADPIGVKGSGEVVMVGAGRHRERGLQRHRETHHRPPDNYSKSCCDT